MSNAMTWSYSFNQVPAAQTTQLIQAQNMMWQFYQLLLGIGWTAVSNNSFGSSGALTWAAAGTAHSWILLSSPDGIVPGMFGLGTGQSSKIYLLIDLNSASSYVASFAFFTGALIPSGGTTTAAPTATSSTANVTTTSGSATITVNYVASGLLLAPGQAITGTGIPSSTTILSGPSGGGAGTYTLSQNCTASSTITATVTPPSALAFSSLQLLNSSFTAACRFHFIGTSAGHFWLGVGYDGVGYVQASLGLFPVISINQNPSTGKYYPFNVLIHAQFSQLNNGPLGFKNIFGSTNSNGGGTVLFDFSQPNLWIFNHDASAGNATVYPYRYSTISTNSGNSTNTLWIGPGVQNSGSPLPVSDPFSGNFVTANITVYSSKGSLVGQVADIVGTPAVTTYGSVDNTTTPTQVVFGGLVLPCNVLPVL